MSIKEITNLKLLKLKQLEDEIELKEGLPHLYGFKDYGWSDEFINTKNKTPVVVCANQVGKSTSQIRRVIKLATDPSLWPEYWPELCKEGQKPTQFWYLYPTRDVATAEFFDKWMPILPQGKFKDDPVTGWKHYVMYKQIHKIEFYSGVTLYFKTYAQDVHSLQSGSCAHIFNDEEVPVELLDELMLRISAQNGYISFVFTATQGQEFWREVVEERSKWPDAQVWQVSMYECQKFTDGSLSRWTNERIEMVKSRCKSEAEIQRRVYGRFIVDSGKKYPTFESRHLIDPVDIPKHWQKYVGLDWGGGGDGHPSAIAFVAVNPDYTKGYVYKFWRGAPKVLTTNEDVLTKFLEMRGEDNIDCIFYDYSARDMGTIAERAGIPLIRANKSHDIGEGSLNTLFKNDMLFLLNDHEEMPKLAREFSSVLISQAKRSAHDDGIDATRYATVSIPWAFDKIVPQYARYRKPDAPELTFTNKLRTGEELIKKQAPISILDEEQQFWMEQMEV